MQLLPFIAVLATALAVDSFEATAVMFDEFKTLKASGRELVVSSGDPLKLKLENGALRDTASNKYVHIDSKDSPVTLNDNEQTGYSLDQNFVKYNGEAAFSCCAEKLNFGNVEKGCIPVGISNLSKSELKKHIQLEMEDDRDDGIDKNFELEMRDNLDEDDEDFELEKRKKSEDRLEKSGKSFRIKAVRPNAKPEFIKKVDGKPNEFYVGGEGKDVVLKFEGKSGVVVDQDGRGIILQGKNRVVGEVPANGRQMATRGFYTQKGRRNERGMYRFRQEGGGAWYKCPVQSGSRLTKKLCPGGKKIALIAEV